MKMTTCIICSSSRNINVEYTECEIGIYIITIL